jgi:hypothetical protein
MTDLINALISKQEEDLRQKREERESKKKAALEKLLSQMREHLGEFWSFLEEYHNKTGVQYLYKWETDNEDIPIRIYYQIPAIPEESLAPIVIKWGPHSNTPHYYDHSQKFQVSGSYLGTLEEALSHARKSYPDYLEKVRKDKIEEFQKETPSYRANGEGLEELYRSLMDKLLAEYPDLEETLRQRFESWKRARAEYLQTIENERRARERREAEAALRNTLLLGYIQSLAEWMKETDAVIERNQKRAQEIQTVSDSRSYTAFQLTYAVVTRYDEDGEEYRDIDLRSAYTMDAGSDNSFFWNIDGERVKFFNPVSLKALQVKASSGILAKRREVSGVELFFAPDVLDEKIEEILQEFETLPDEPGIPEGLSLDHYEKSDARGCARHYLETGDLETCDRNSHF